MTRSVFTLSAFVMLVGGMAFSALAQDIPPPKVTLTPVTSPASSANPPTKQASVAAPPKTQSAHGKTITLDAFLQAQRQNGTPWLDPPASPR